MRHPRGQSLLSVITLFVVVPAKIVNFLLEMGIELNSEQTELEPSFLKEHNRTEPKPFLYKFIKYPIQTEPKQ